MRSNYRLSHPPDDNEPNQENDENVEDSSNGEDDSNSGYSSTTTSVPDSSNDKTNDFGGGESCRPQSNFSEVNFQPVVSATEGHGVNPPPVIRTARMSTEGHGVNPPPVIRTARMSTGGRCFIPYVRPKPRNLQTPSDAALYRAVQPSNWNFNGFEMNLEPEVITGHRWIMTAENRIELQYSVIWRNYGQHSLYIDSSVIRAYRPQMIIDYWENELRTSWSLPGNNEP